MLSSTLTHLQKIMQTKIYQIGHLLPVWPSNKLLASTRHQNLIKEIQELSALPEAHFKALYKSAINRYAEFVQVIPDEPQGALSGLLNLGLSRALLGLKQFVAEAGDKAEADPLLNYGVFTAALFFDAAKVISQQKIVICDEEGNYLEDWRPYLGSLVDQGREFYKMYPYTGSIYQALNHETAALLARQMMPAEGFVWLSSDLDLFIDWLDALRGEGGHNGRKLSRALSLIRQEDLINLIKHLQQIPIELIAPKDLPFDDQFYIWLREGLANGSIGINTNEANVHLLDDGTLYLNNEIFKRFQETIKTPVDVNKLANDFNKRFGVNSEVTAGREYATFLMQRGTQKTIQVRNGMFAFGALFLIDMVTVGAAISPLQDKIRAAFQTTRELPSGIKSALTIERPQTPNSTFRMR
jgi:Putative helicase/Putative conjugal transfer nickase/helicase TraI C-term